jgi:hypothetical protein
MDVGQPLGTSSHGLVVRAGRALLVLWFCVLAPTVWAQHPPAEAPDVRHAETLFPVPTLGGKQFWADELLFADWRIQRNVLTDQCRLLDGNNWRRASGTFEECSTMLAKIKREQKLLAPRGRAVLVLHGLGRDRAMMEPLCRYLRANSRFNVYSFGYASTQAGVAHHARCLAHVIERLEGGTELNFVAHSLGNIVVRHYFADCQAVRADRLAPPLGRMVMLGPPNHGSEIATALARSDWFVTATGRAGLELGAKWADLEPRLATPPCPFGIIAGGRGNAQGFNPLLPTDDDGLVTVASTQLSDATDFIRLPVLHTLLPSDGKVLEYTLRFLENGCFVSPAQRHAIH